MSFGGYSGYYNGNVIHSSFEYVFCKILENKNIPYKTQLETYNLGYKRYTPDFFILDKNNNIIKIIEIRGYRLNIEERIKDTNALKEKIVIPINLITEIDLKDMCKKIKLPYEKLITEWRNRIDTFKNLNCGELNPMFGKKQTEKTKSLIGNKARERFLNDDYRNNISLKMKEYYKNADKSYLTAPRSKRVSVKCVGCNKEFIVTEKTSAKRIYCSLECANKYNKGLELATKQKILKRTNKHKKVKSLVLEWAINNKQTILHMKLNKIVTNIKSLLEEVEKQFDIKDIRIITRATFNTDSRKDFAIKLKEFVSSK